MRLLVTGITGFLGRRLLSVAESDSRALRIVGVGRDRELLDACANNHVADAMHQVDLASSEAAGRLIEALATSAIHTFVHLAALLTSHEEDSSRAPELYGANTAGTLRTWTAIAATPAELRPRRFVLASSVLVYGWPHIDPVSEGQATDPRDNYGMSKLGAEAYSVYMASRLGVELVILRLGYVYGPGDDSGKAVERFLRRAAHGQDLVVSAPPGTFRDYVFVDDVVRCVLECLDPDIVRQGIVNVSSGASTTPLELAEAARATTGSSSPLIERPGRTSATTEGYGCTLMDSTLGAALFGPWTSLHDGLATTVRVMRHA